MKSHFVSIKGKPNKGFIGKTRIQTPYLDFQTIKYLSVVNISIDYENINDFERVCEIHSNFAKSLTWRKKRGNEDLRLLMIPLCTFKAQKKSRFQSNKIAGELIICSDPDEYLELFLFDPFKNKYIDENFTVVVDIKLITE